MAKGKVPKGKPFEKSESGNPGGRPKLEYNAIEAKSLTRSEVLCAMHNVMSMARKDIDQMCDPDITPYASGANALMAAVLSKAIAMGCPTRAQFFMSYLFGRPTDYDPTKDDTRVDPKKNLNAIPSEVIIRAYNEFTASLGQSAS